MDVPCRINGVRMDQYLIYGGGERGGWELTETVFIIGMRVTACLARAPIACSSKRQWQDAIEHNSRIHVPYRGITPIFVRRGSQKKIGVRVIYTQPLCILILYCDFIILLLMLTNHSDSN